MGRSHNYIFSAFIFFIKRERKRKREYITCSVLINLPPIIWLLNILQLSLVRVTFTWHLCMCVSPEFKLTVSTRHLVCVPQNFYKTVKTLKSSQSPFLSNICIISQSASLTNKVCSINFSHLSLLQDPIAIALVPTFIFSGLDYSQNPSYIIS